MALAALRVYVAAGQGEPGRGMIERGSGPTGYVVTGVAGCGKSSRLVTRIGGLVEIRHVTVGARPAGQVVILIDVALRALQAGMSAGQRKSSRGVVIELRPLPTQCCVTSVALGGKVTLSVARIVRFLKVSQMTAGTLRRRSGELPSGVALHATDAGVRPG
jgi:hypothetical protein